MVYSKRKFWDFGISGAFFVALVITSVKKVNIINYLYIYFLYISVNIHFLTKSYRRIHILESYRIYYHTIQ